jgi:hypothetical protein
MAFQTEAWHDKAFVSVSPIGGSEVEMRTKTTSFAASGGNFDIEGLDTFGGKITSIGTKEDIDLSFDTIPVAVSDTDWIFSGATSSATSITSSTVTRYRVAILWTNDTSITSGAEAVGTSSEAYRQIYAETYCVEGMESNFNAGENLTGTLKFKLSTEDPDGGQNWKKESCDTTSALSALSAYTTGNKF